MNCFYMCLNRLFFLEAVNEWKKSELIWDVGDFMLQIFFQRSSFLKFERLLWLSLILFPGLLKIKFNTLRHVYIWTLS